MPQPLFAQSVQVGNGNSISVTSKKDWYYQITGWTNLSIEKTFLFSKNKAFSKKFYETQDLKVIFLRNTGSKFYETQDI